MRLFGKRSDESSDASSGGLRWEEVRDEDREFYRFGIERTNPALRQIATALMDAGIANDLQAEAFIDSIARQVYEARR